MRIKLVLLALFKCFTNFIMFLPSHSIRLLYLKMILGRLGSGSTVCRNVEIRNPRNIFIGSNTIINKRVLLDGRGGQLIIGDNVDIAQDVYLWTMQHDYNDKLHSQTGGSLHIEDYVWIASRANVLPNVRIKKGAVIGTCSLVTKDVDTMDIVGGVPAKKISNRINELTYRLYHRPLFG